MKQNKIPLHFVILNGQIMGNIRGFTLGKCLIGSSSESSKTP